MNPQLETHILEIDEQPQRTRVKAQFFIVSDAGLDQWGQQAYARKLVKEVDRTFEAGDLKGELKLAIVADLLGKAKVENSESKLAFAEADIICEI